MKIRKNKIFNFIILLISILTFGCSESLVNSSWLNNEINIDGYKNDWQGSLKYYDEEKVVVGIKNNGEYIYFCLATSDNNKITKILRTGFTVWLNPQDSDGEKIGIQYPIKRDKNEPVESGDRQDKKAQPNNEKMSKMVDSFKANQNELLIVNSDNFPLNAFSNINDFGLEAKIDYNMQQLVYELKVPLSTDKNSSFYIDALPGELLEVGFESGEFEKPSGGDRNSRSKGQAGEMSGGGRKGGMRGKNRSSKQEMTVNMDPIEFWFDVKLAQEK